MKKLIIWMCFGFLLLTGLFSIFSETVAPYRFDSEFRSDSFMPRSKIHFIHKDGKFSWHPFIYTTQTTLDEFHRKQIHENTTKEFPIRFWIKGEPYTWFFIFKSDRHLFGVEGDKRIYLLGSDGRGRDLFSRIVYGGRISLSVGLLGVFLSTLIALIIGGVSGYFGGSLDQALMRLSELVMMIPGFYLLLALRSALPMQFDSRAVYLLIICVLSFIGWGALARTIRGMVFSIREEDFVKAAKVLGSSDRKIIFKHVLPQTWSIVIVMMSTAIPGFILSESALSLIGLGIQDPYASWGSLLSDAMTLSQLELHPWVLWPGVVITLTILCFNTLGDYLRDLNDPERAIYES